MASIDDVLLNLKENTINFTVPLLTDSSKSFVFRPIKTKDQKTLIIEREENDGAVDFELKNLKSILKLIDLLLIKSPSPIADIKFSDFVWLLINIRAKSIGETLELVATCHSCKEKFDFNVNILKEIRKTEPRKNINNLVKVTDKVTLHLGCLDVGDLVYVMAGNEQDRNKNSMASSIKKVEFSDELVDIGFDNKVAILDELSKEKLEEINKYIEDSNYDVKLEKNYTCPKCKHEGQYSFNSYEIVSFF